MALYTPKGALERSAGANLARYTLSQIPTVYGRLVYLGSLRNPNSGAYRHHGLVATYGREQSIRALHSSHTKSFRDWLGLSLEEKSADLREFLDSQDEPRPLVVQYWIQSRRYLNCVPDSATKAERRLYEVDIEALLGAFSRVAGA